MRVFVYYNVRKKLFSIKALSGDYRGRVLWHAFVVELLDATFSVSEAGRLRVLATGRKNVHAGVRGTLRYFGLIAQPHSAEAVRVAYNPKRDTGFIGVVSRLPVPLRASRVVLSTEGGLR